MTDAPPLTRVVGQAERTLQSLLHAQLRAAAMSFPEWAAFTHLNDAGTLGFGRLAETLENGRIVAPGEGARVIGEMAEAGWIARDGAGVSISAAGAARYRPLRERVQALTSELVADLPAPDVDATRRTLETITRRAARHLDAGAP